MPRSKILIALLAASFWLLTACGDEYQAVTFLNEYPSDINVLMFQAPSRAPVTGLIVGEKVSTPVRWHVERLKPGDTGDLFHWSKGQKVDGDQEFVFIVVDHLSLTVLDYHWFTYAQIKGSDYVVTLLP